MEKRRLPKSYCPINLSPLILKTLVTLADRHVSDRYLKVDNLSHDQYEFRRNRSTDSALVYDVEAAANKRVSRGLIA